MDGGPFHVRPEGANLMLAFRCDRYHRAWRGFLFAMNHAVGHFTHTAVQLNLIFNVNYQPFGQGAFFSKRQELKMEWEQLFPTPALDSQVPASGSSFELPAESFEELCDAISQDARCPPPRTMSEVRALWGAVGLGQ